MSALPWSLWKDFEKKCISQFVILGTQLKTPESKEGNLWGGEESYHFIHIGVLRNLLKEEAQKGK